MAKRNKILFAGLSSVFVLGLAIALVNKGNPLFENKASECDHQLNHHDAVASTTESEGNYGYYICCKCHNSFFDEQATRQIGAGKPSTPRRIAEPTNAALKTLNASKMKFMDQSEFFTDYDNNGDVEYVTIAGKEAIRFSQSKTGYTVTKGSGTAAENVGKADYADGKAPSEFRFTLDKTLLLSSFEYDYLYWDVTDENVGSDAGITDKHAFFQVNTVDKVDYHELNPVITSGDGNYAPFEASLENAKGEWDVDNLVWKHVKVTLAKPVKSSNFITKITGFTGEMYVANPVATYVEKEYNAATGVDANYGTSIKDDFGLDEGSKYDAVPRILLKDTGITNAQFKNRDHLWGKYDYATNGGIDITIPFTYSYELDNESQRDNYVIYYVYSNGIEGGVVVRINQSSNNGNVSAYIYASDASFVNSGGTLVSPAGAAGTYFVARDTGITNGTEAFVRIRSVITDKTTNTVSTVVSIGKQTDGIEYVFKGADGVHADKSEVTAVLGAGYFTSMSNNKFRATMISASDTVAAETTINQSFALPSRVVYKNEDGLVFGTKNIIPLSKVSLPVVKKDGYFLMGWYNQNGVRVTSDTALLGENNLTARFEVERANKLLPSDFDLAGKSFDTSSDNETANIINDASKLADATRLDVYINYKNDILGTGDSYVVIGFPYDFLNAKSRIQLRFATRDVQETLSGYFFGSGNLGPAGETNGTKFTDDNFKWNFNHNFLIHMYIETVNAATGVYNVGAEFVDLGTGNRSAIDRQVTLETGTDCYSMADKRTNRLCIQKQNGSGGFSISDPFAL